VRKKLILVVAAIAGFGVAAIIPIASAHNGWQPTTTTKTSPYCQPGDGGSSNYCECPPGDGGSGNYCVHVRKCHVPRLEGLTVDAAKQLLNRDHCRLGRVFIVKRGQPGPPNWPPTTTTPTTTTPTTPTTTWTTPSTTTTTPTTTTPTTPTSTETTTTPTTSTPTTPTTTVQVTVTTTTPTTTTPTPTGHKHHKKHKKHKKHHKAKPKAHHKKGHHGKRKGHKKDANKDKSHKSHGHKSHKAIVASRRHRSGDHGHQPYYVIVAQHPWPGTRLRYGSSVDVWVKEVGRGHGGRRH
jgi:hypothetical protein